MKASVLKRKKNKNTTTLWCEWPGEDIPDMGHAETLLMIVMSVFALGKIRIYKRKKSTTDHPPGGFLSQLFPTHQPARGPYSSYKNNEPWSPSPRLLHPSLSPMRYKQMAFCSRTGARTVQIFLPSMETLLGGWVIHRVQNSFSSMSCEQHRPLDAINLQLCKKEHWSGYLQLPSKKPIT
ncbi:hypothetical protein SK128_016488 [Halocaridina rubra]|uniref:Uncharacterized protein n=1 Tax=Halocaridina rubra TaxID=373956 RepID=A0AAN8X8S3_HALRR